MTDWWLDSVARHQVKTSTLDSYRKFASHLADDIGTHRVIDVGPEVLTQWQSKLLDKYAPYTVLNCRKVCRQAFTEAVKFRLIPANPFDLVKAPRAKRVKAGRALSPTDAKALITAAQDLRLGAAVTLLFCQGWRVSEVLGLAWEDLDLDVGTAQIRRGASYTPSVGMVLGSTRRQVPKASTTLLRCPSLISASVESLSNSSAKQWAPNGKPTSTTASR